MTVRLGSLAQTISYYGDIKAEYEVKVFSKIPDRIERFFVDAGDQVAKGTPLARIAATTIEQAVRQAEAALTAAKAQAANLRSEYDRFALLYRDLSVSKQQFDAVATQYEAAQAQVEQAEAALASAKSQWQDATITAPIAGIIGKRYCEAGDMATPALPLVSVCQMERVKMTFEATEKDLAKLNLGQQTVVQVSTYPDRVFAGKVVQISPVLDPLSRMAEVEVVLDNPGYLLKPGMYARAEVTTGVIENVILVPRHAVIENTSLERSRGEDQVVKHYFVFVVEGEKAVQRRLEVIDLNHEHLAIASGLQIGEQLVTVGQNNLREGAPVAVVRKDADQS
ncbi:efflux RND transporter periplasmic adaptor subunit [candidate division KSB1 bacterium]|nr:efflux RND transporter periplasmic adaptor subunit [bacterium]NUM68226.1 efflux RND transporter periplasmic adaptor subunit [candidate division KSB1 bacterium]